MYQVIFTGVREGVTRLDAIINLAALFKTTPEQVEKLLASSGHVLKKGITQELAGKYRAAIESAGGACRVEQEIAQIQTSDTNLPLTPPSREIPTNDQELTHPNERWKWLKTGMVVVIVLALYWWIGLSHIFDKKVNSENTISQTSAATDQSLVGVWRCKQDEDSFVEEARFPDGTFVIDDNETQQGYEELEAGSYRFDGQRNFETFKAERFVRLPPYMFTKERIELHMNDGLAEWQEGSKTDNALESEYSTREYQVIQFSENQHDLRMVRVINWDGRDTKEKVESPIHCVRADQQLYQKLEAIRKQIPPQLL